MKKAIMSILTVWILVSSVFIVLISFSDIENVKAPYVSHDPIRINSDAEFASMAGLEGWAGNGLPGSPYIIEGYDINGSGYGYCIYIGNTTVYFMVRDCFLHEASGLSSWPYFNCYGLILYYVQNGVLSNNTASLNSNSGIYLYSSSNNIIENNTTLNNFIGIELRYSNDNTITNNTALTNKPQWGIYLEQSNSNTIANNNASSNYAEGILLVHSNSNFIRNNTAFLNSNSGIYLSSSSNNAIASNTASNNSKYGIRLDSSGSNTVANNTISSNNYSGIRLYSSSSNTIANNKVSLNSIHGINFYWTSNSNTIANNTVSNNSNYGFYLESSSSNTIYHNNFIDNANQAFDNTNNGNQWDNGYPSGGNYWSDYTGIDLNSTGNQDVPPPDDIGDSPYIIDSDSQDNYPLFYPVGDYIFLNQGWNLVSIPFNQSDTDLDPVLSSIYGSYNAVQWYNASDSSDPWKHYQISKPSHLNDLTDIDYTKGFWIHITEPGGVLFEYFGTQPTSNQSIHLHPGWNMVGYPSLSNRNRTAALNNLTFGSEVDAIWTFDAATQTWEEVGGGDYFEVGRGYWIHATKECVWEVLL